MQVPEDSFLQSGVYDLLSLGSLNSLHHDHPYMRGSPQFNGIAEHSSSGAGELDVADADAPVEAALLPSGPASNHLATSAATSPPPAAPPPPALADNCNAGLQDVVYTTSGMKLASSHMMAHGQEPPLTTKTATFAGCLDYIWLSADHFSVMQTLEMPYANAFDSQSPEDVSDLGPIPDQHHFSDHLAVGCVVQLLVS